MSETYAIREIDHNAIAVPDSSRSAIRAGNDVVNAVISVSIASSAVPASIVRLCPKRPTSRPDGTSKIIVPIRTPDTPSPTRPTPTPISSMKLGRTGISIPTPICNRKLGTYRVHRSDDRLNLPAPAAVTRGPGSGGPERRGALCLELLKR